MTYQRAKKRKESRRNICYPQAARPSQSATKRPRDGQLFS